MKRTTKDLSTAYMYDTKSASAKITTGTASKFYRYNVYKYEEALLSSEMILLN